MSARVATGCWLAYRGCRPRSSTGWWGTSAGCSSCWQRGLSRQDRLTVETLVGCLVAAVADEGLRPMLVGLPVAGFSGTLIDPYLEPPSQRAAGLLRGKTGTLAGVTAEAGFVVPADGGLRVFVVVADEVPFDTDAARDRIDEAMSQLAR